LRLFAILLLATAPAPAAELSDLVAGPVEKVVGDCNFTEGPAWHPDGFLLFSDIPNERIVRVNADGASSDWMRPSGGANGLMCDRQGNVYACQGGLQRVARLRSGADGKGIVAAVLAAQFEGKPFNRPNDLALDNAGGVYFTDPNYRQAPPEQPVQGVYYVNRAGQVTRVVDDLPRPNGILVSQDGKRLYVANIERRQIMQYDIAAPGRLSGANVLFTGDEQLDGNGPDGMALDAQGNLYGSYKTVVVVTADGALVGRINVPEKPANCKFGGADNKTLYITARTSLYKAPMKVAGVPLQAEGPQGPAVAAVFNDSLQFVGAGDDPPAGDTVTVMAKDLKLTVPKAWKQQEPSNRLRLAQFVVPKAEGDPEDGEFVVFPPFGGSDADNIKRWIDQFQPEGRKVTMTQAQTEQGEYVFVDLTGTYLKPIGPPIQRKNEPAPGFRALNVIFKAKAGGNYFLKLTGPEKTVNASAAAVRSSFGAKADAEKEYKLPE
jgi:gluconolactonase